MAQSITQAASDAAQYNPPMFQGERGASLISVGEENKPLIDPLLPRQQEVLILVACGLSDKEIAGELGLSPHTVTNYFSSDLGGIHQRLNTHRREEAVFMALQRKEITLEGILTRGKFNLPAYSTLKPKEAKVLERFIEFGGGVDDGNLAKSLKISYHQLERRWGNIYRKLGAGNRAQAMVFTLAVKAEKANRLTSSQPIQ